MELQIDDQGNISYHCSNPDCTHHNCANWKHVRCGYEHAPTSGQTHQIHISHEGVQWLNERNVQLPQCHCGTSHTAIVAWSAQELAEPKLIRGSHPITGQEITIDVDLQGGAPNFTRILEHTEKHLVADDEKVKKLVAVGFPEAAARVLAPPIPVYTRVIDGIIRHPAITHHPELARQLKAIGKVPPGE